MTIDSLKFAQINEYIELKFGNENRTIIHSDEIKERFGLPYGYIDDLIEAASKYDAKYNIVAPAKDQGLFCDIIFVRFDNPE